MQNTRLSTIVDRTANQIDRTFRNPWRRVSLLLLSLLLGFLLGNVISTSAGQRAELDVIAAFILLLMTETVSRLTYGSGSFGVARSANRNLRRSLLFEVANGLKIGIIYSLFLDAFKLGS